MAITNLRIRRPNEDIEGLRFKAIADRFGLNLEPPQQEELNASQYPQEGITTGPNPEDALDREALGALKPEAEATIGLPGTAGQPRQDFKSMMDQINEAYKPETQDTERFRGLLDQFPQREEPGFLRKLVAGGIGLDARQRVGTQGQEFTARGDPGRTIAAMEGVMYAPHLRELSDWKEKTQPFYNAANLERQENIQNRTLVSNAVNAETQQRRIEENARLQDEKNRIAAEKNQILWFKQMHPEWKFDTRGAEILAWDPANPLEVHKLGPTGNLDAFTRMMLAFTTQSAIQTQRDEAAGQRQQAQINRPPDAEEQRRRQIMRTEHEYFNDPKGTKFIERIGNGYRLIDPITQGGGGFLGMGGWSAEDVRDYEAMKRRIQGTGAAPTGAGAGAGAGAEYPGTPGGAGAENRPPPPPGMPTGPGVIGPYWNSQTRQYAYSTDGGKTWKYSTPAPGGTPTAPPQSRNTNPRGPIQAAPPEPLGNVLFPEAGGIGERPWIKRPGTYTAD